MNFCIIGSSKRHNELCKCLTEQKHICTCYESYLNLPEKLYADCIIFPIPTTKNGLLNLADAPYDVTPENIMQRATKETFAITCNYNLANCRFYDIAFRDDFAYLNAVPTAEGAIKLAIDCSENSISAQNILITGFGRVAKILADRLRGLNCKVTVAARSLKDRYYAAALGLNHIKISELYENVNKFDIIFQTIPARVLSEEIVSKISSESTIIELSSGMIGTDLSVAEKYNVKLVDGTRLPERIAPISAGKIWAETITSIISEQSDGNGQN